jgi:hypothetical protein
MPIMVLKITLLSIGFFLCPLTLQTQRLATSEEQRGEFVIRPIVPLEKFVGITPVEGGLNEKSAVALEKSELSHLVINFRRDNLREEDGPQFIKITTTLTKREGNVYDKITQYAFTFAKEAIPDSEDARIRMYAQKIVPFGFVSRRKIDSVDVHLDSLSDWGVVKIDVTPDEEYTKYSRRFQSCRTWYYRTKGNRWEIAFFLGIPKVLYDTEKRDSVAYGNASVMLRLFFLDGETGSRYPLNIGIGTFGISTPIDVSKNGGGFVISLFLDVVQLLNTNFNLDLSSRFNGGLEVTPFFPIDHRARLLVNVRIGISP